MSEVCSAPQEQVIGDVSVSLRQKVLQEYGIANARPEDYEIDYLIAPRLGGTEDIRNLWPYSADCAAGRAVRIRLINLGMDHHPIHLHGHQFVVTGTEGGRQPETTWGPGNTVLVGVAQSRDIEFVANNPGDWTLHCHLPHHMMNQMSSNVGPMTRRNGMPAGLDMERGMGMLRQGSATSEENGRSLGQGTGVVSSFEQRTTKRLSAQLSDTLMRMLRGAPW
jgi:hypothetical protein